MSRPHAQEAGAGFPCRRSSGALSRTPDGAAPPKARLPPPPGRARRLAELAPCRAPLLAPGDPAAACLARATCPAPCGLGQSCRIEQAPSPGRPGRAVEGSELSADNVLVALPAGPVEPSRSTTSPPRAARTGLVGPPVGDKVAAPPIGATPRSPCTPPAATDTQGARALHGASGCSAPPGYPTAPLSIVRLIGVRLVCAGAPTAARFSRAPPPASQAMLERRTRGRRS